MTLGRFFVVKGVFDCTSSPGKIIFAPVHDAEIRRLEKQLQLYTDWAKHLASVIQVGDVVYDYDKEFAWWLLGQKS